MTGCITLTFLEGLLRMHIERAQTQPTLQGTEAILPLLAWQPKRASLRRLTLHT